MSKLRDLYKPSGDLSVWRCTLTWWRNAGVNRAVILVSFHSFVQNIQNILTAFLLTTITTIGDYFALTTHLDHSCRGYVTAITVSHAYAIILCQDGEIAAAFLAANALFLWKYFCFCHDIVEHFSLFLTFYPLLHVQASLFFASYKHWFCCATVVLCFCFCFFLLKN